MMETGGTFGEMNRREFYTKRGERRRLKSKAARRRLRTAARKHARWEQRNDPHGKNPTRRNVRREVMTAA
jgi:ribosomal protein S21